MSESNPFDDLGFDPRQVERLVSIHYYGRSGSIFLQSLLDGHPDVLTFPANYLGGYYSFWLEYGELSPLHIVKAFLHHYEVLFDPTTAEEVFDAGAYTGLEYDFDKMGPNHDEALGVDRQRFGDILLKKCMIEVGDFENGRLERKFFLQALHVAYAEALGRDLTGRRPLIVFQAHTPHVDKIEAMLSDRQDVDRLLDAKTARKMDAERKAFVAEKMPKLRQVMMAFDRQQQQKRAPRKPAKIRIKERPRAR